MPAYLWVFAGQVPDLVHQYKIKQRVCGRKKTKQRQLREISATVKEPMWSHGEVRGGKDVIRDGQEILSWMLGK